MDKMERMPMDASDKETLRLAAHRFAWMTLVLYAALTVGLWLVHSVVPSVLGPSMHYDYLVSVSLMASLAFGGLYAAALALRPLRPGEPRAIEDR